MFSGGVGSWAAAKRVALAHGDKDLTLLFCDTKVEHPDTYRFLREGAENVGGTLVEIADGRTIWEVFRDVKFLGNSRVDPCSRVLKRELADKWLDDNCDIKDTVVYVGIDWSEVNRYNRLAERKLPWRYEAPLLDKPWMSKSDMHRWATSQGIRKQYLYQIGMSHANCGGGCIKMGQGGFAHLFKKSPETYAEWERHESEMQEQLGERGGRPVTILKDSLSLKDLRERILNDRQVDLFDVGGCGCFLDDDD